MYLYEEKDTLLNPHDNSVQTGLIWYTELKYHLIRSIILYYCYFLFPQMDSIKLYKVCIF